MLTSAAMENFSTVFSRRLMNGYKGHINQLMKERGISPKSPLNSAESTPRVRELRQAWQANHRRREESLNREIFDSIFK